MKTVISPVINDEAEIIFILIDDLVDNISTTTDAITIIMKKYDAKTGPEDHLSAVINTGLKKSYLIVLT